MVEAIIMVLVVIVFLAAGLAAWRLAIGPARTLSSFLLRAGCMSLLCALLVGFVAWKLMNARTVQMFGGIVPRVHTSEPVVALTLDDGPTQEHTEKVLSVLREHDVRATFFVTGKALLRNPEEAKRIVEEGHELGNHSLRHQRMILKPYSFVREEIETTDQLIRDAGYQGRIHFRSPFGKKLIVLPYYLWQTDRLNIFWDVAPEGYTSVAADPERMVEHVLAEVRPGSIILLHVLPKKRAISRQALPGIIQGLQERGYRFVTVSDLLEAR